MDTSANMYHWLQLVLQENQRTENKLLWNRPCIWKYENKEHQDLCGIQGGKKSLTGERNPLYEERKQWILFSMFFNAI